MIRQVAYSWIHIVIWFCYLALLLYSTLTPLSLPPMGIEHEDKFLHLGAFFVLAFIFPWTILYYRQICVFLSLTSIGCIIEILQAILPINRSGDPIDAAADMLGVICGIVAVNLIARNRFSSRI